MLALAGAGVASSPDRPVLSGTTLDGRRFSMADERGRVVLINFWATWCAPCQSELPMIDAYYKAHHGEGLDMLAVSLDAGVSRARLMIALKTYAFPAARVVDVKMPPEAIPTGLPTTRIYGRDGVLRYDSGIDSKQPSSASLERLVGPLLAERPGPDH